MGRMGAQGKPHISIAYYDDYMIKIKNQLQEGDTKNHEKLKKYQLMNRMNLFQSECVLTPTRQTFMGSNTHPYLKQEKSHQNIYNLHIFIFKYNVLIIMSLGKIITIIFTSRDDFRYNVNHFQHRTVSNQKTDNRGPDFDVLNILSK